MTIWKIDINSQWRVNFVAFLCQKFLFACFEIPSLVVGTAVEKYEPNSILREAVSNLHNFLLCINKTIIRNTKHSLDKRYGVMETKPKASWREMDMYFHLGVARIVGPIQCAALTGIMSFQFIVRVYVQKKKTTTTKMTKTRSLLWKIDCACKVWNVLMKNSNPCIYNACRIAREVVNIATRMLIPLQRIWFFLNISVRVHTAHRTVKFVKKHRAHINKRRVNKIYT